MQTVCGVLNRHSAIAEPKDSATAILQAQAIVSVQEAELLQLPMANSCPANHSMGV